MAAGVATGGCRTTESDIHRWANTLNGPRKLVAVVTHDKYPLELRVEAAATLVSMKPRGGRHVGLEGLEEGTEKVPGLLDALASLPPAERNQIVDRLVPRLIAQMQIPPPKAQAGQPTPPDPSFAYKDAAFALLTYEGGSLVTNAENRAKLKTALATWAMADFERRMDESSQSYGMEQVLRYLGAQGVRELPSLLEPGASKVDQISKLVAELGDEDTKQRASQRLVRIAQEIDSERWIKRKAPSVEAANKASKLNPTAKQFKAQLAQYQEEQLLKVLASMKRVGGKPVVSYLLGFATNTKKDEKRRAAALAALEGNLDKQSAKQADTLLDLAKSDDTPDVVRDIALRRIGEFPRKLVADKLYKLFESENWKVRWVAAELLLKMSDTEHMPEFMRQLGKTDDMAITEPLRYGALLAAMKGKPKPKQVADRFLKRGHPVEARLSALGYYFEKGTPEDESTLKPLRDDRQKVPKCAEDAVDCEWKCAIGSGKEQEIKDIETVGDFVRYCVEPEIERRAKAKKSSKGKK